MSSHAGKAKVALFGALNAVIATAASLLLAPQPASADTTAAYVTCNNTSCSVNSYTSSCSYKYNTECYLAKDSNDQIYCSGVWSCGK
jgi:hypothetical protein